MKSNKIEGYVTDMVYKGIKFTLKLVKTCLHYQTIEDEVPRGSTYFFKIEWWLKDIVMAEQLWDCSYVTKRP